MIVRGAFDLKWGDNLIQGIEEVEFDFEIDSEDYQTIQGKTIEVDGPQKAAVTITLLESDIPALAALLPQHFVENGGVLSTGETVSHAQGAIDVVPQDCDEDLVYNNLDIISCGNPGEVTRVVNARTKLEGVEFDNKLRKIMVKFVGESEDSEATLQFFKENSVSVVS